MAQNYYNVEKAAEILGVSPDEVRKMRERNELHGYRDGANWKFKAEDIERFAKARSIAPADDDLSEDITIQHPGTGSSGAMIGATDKGLGSDIQFAVMDSGIKLDTPAAQSDDSDLKLIDDAILDSRPKLGKGPTADSSNALGGDDLVLSPSGDVAASDIRDSGIALIDPRDSGLALDEPIELGAGGEDDGLQLGEDDLLAGKDDDFLLTPLAAGEDDDTESGSQVIALDTEPSSEDAATIIGTPSKANLVAMLDEDAGPVGMGALSVAPGTPMMAGAGIGAPLGMGASAEMAPMVEALPEEPYSAFQVVLLVLCVVVLAFGTAMMYDLVRNMSSWGTPYELNSSIMDWVLKLVEGK